VWSWHSKCIDSLHVLTQSYATIFQCPGVSANQLLLWTYIRPQHSDLMWHGSLAAAGCAAWVHAFTNGGHASAQKEMSFSITFPLLVRWLQCRRCIVHYCLSATIRGAVSALALAQPEAQPVLSFEQLLLRMVFVGVPIFQCPGVWRMYAMSVLGTLT
jgi:hypothetical protein